jgi:ABC-type phosphate transport system permease subunit
MDAPDKSRAMISFVLGLLAVTGTCVFLGPVAIMMARSYTAECQAAGVEPDGMAKVGMILGIVGTIFMVLTVLFLTLYFGLIAAVVLMEL